VQDVEELHSDGKGLASPLAESEAFAEAQRLAGPPLAAEVAEVSLLSTESAQRSVDPCSGIQHCLNVRLEAPAVQVFQIQRGSRDPELPAALPGIVGADAVARSRRSQQDTALILHPGADCPARQGEARRNVFLYEPVS